MTNQCRKVVMVDDDVDFLEANRVAFEALGFEVFSATDSREGVELARREKPDLILVDLMMEELHSGFSAVEALHAHEETRDIPIIMVSAVTTETGFRVDQGGRKPDWLNVVEFINKPANPVQLARRAASILDPDRRPGK